MKEQAERHAPVRHYQEKDTPALTAVHRALFPQQSLTPGQLHRRLYANGRSWVVLVDGEPVGYATVDDVPGLPGVVELAGGIAPARQRQGLGSRLLQQVIRELRSGDVVQLSYAVDSEDTPAAHFLRRHGFFMEHVEWLMELDDLQTRNLPVSIDAGASLRLRPTLSPADFCALYEQIFAGLPWCQPYTPTEVMATRRPNDEMFCLLRQNEPIGFAWVRYDTPDRAEIEPIGIMKEERGKGYGCFLLQSILQRLRARRVNQVRLGVWENNETAVHLYRQLGFQRIHTRIYLAYNL